MSMANRQALPECNAQQRQAYTEQIRAWNRTYEAEHGKARQVFVMTFGCQQNEADSEKLAGMAVDMGYRRVDTPDAADLILVNDGDPSALEDEVQKCLALWEVST